MITIKMYDRTTILDNVVADEMSGDAYRRVPEHLFEQAWSTVSSKQISQFEKELGID